MLLHRISPARMLCAAAALASALASIDGTPSGRSAHDWRADNEVAVQTNARRLEFGDLVYAGGFRLPAQRSNDDSFAGGGQAIAFNPEKPSLFVSSVAGGV